MTHDPATPRPSRPTLRQVAALSGVSAKTVSRVLNDEPYVTEATAAKVRKAAEQLGFRLNVLARDLRAGAPSTTVGLLIGDLANPFFSRIARGAERELRSQGLQLITASTDEEADLEYALAQDLLDRRVCALLVVPSSVDHSYLDGERRHGLPVVFLDRPGNGVVADTILLDNAGGARQAVQHLLAHGHTRIGLVGDQSRLSTQRERMKGFLDAMAAAGIAVEDDYLRPDSYDMAKAQASVHELLELAEPPTALFTTNNRITAGALRALAAAAPGTRLPALVGFDDVDFGDLLGVTVLSHDPEEMGRIAASMALDRIGGDKRPPRTVVLSTVLVPRGSGERPPPA